MYTDRIHREIKREKEKGFSSPYIPYYFLKAIYNIYLPRKREKQRDLSFFLGEYRIAKGERTFGILHMSRYGNVTVTLHPRKIADFTLCSLQMISCSTSSVYPSFSVDFAP